MTTTQQKVYLRIKYNPDLGFLRVGRDFNAVQQLIAMGLVKSTGAIRGGIEWFELVAKAKGENHA